MGRIAGPFSEPPFKLFHVSPLNVHEKKTPGKYRLIHDLSHPYDETSINHNIPDDKKKVKYGSVGDAIKLLLKLPNGSYMCKTDIADAFELIPVHLDDYPKLGISFQGKYYYDKHCHRDVLVLVRFLKLLAPPYKPYLNIMSRGH